MKQLPNIHFLKYFYSAGKHLSMSKAAAENFVTQSAISQGIHKLELELGIQLISSRKNKLELTSDGELLLDKCENIFSLFSTSKIFSMRRQVSTVGNSPSDKS